MNKMTDEWHNDWHKLIVSSSEHLTDDNRVTWKFISLLCAVCEIPLHGWSER